MVEELHKIEFKNKEITLPQLESSNKKVYANLLWWIEYDELIYAAVYQIEKPNGNFGKLVSKTIEVWK